MKLNPETARDLILRKGSISEAATAVGESRSNLSNVLAGRRNARPDLIASLADYLGINPYRLLGPEDPRAAVVELARLYDLKPADLVPA